METEKEISKRFDKHFCQIVKSLAGDDLILGARMEKIVRGFKPEILWHHRDLVQYKKAMEKTHQEKISSLTEPYVNKIINMMDDFAEEIIIDEDEIGENISGSWAEISEIIDREEPHHIINLCEAEIVLMERAERVFGRAEQALFKIFQLSFVPQFDLTVN